MSQVVMIGTYNEAMAQDYRATMKLEWRSSSNGVLLEIPGGYKRVNLFQQWINQTTGESIWVEIEGL